MLIKIRIKRYIDSSLTSIVKVFKKVLKGAVIIIYKLVLV
jgi:hypothetical protein